MDSTKERKKDKDKQKLDVEVRPLQETLYSRQPINFKKRYKSSSDQEASTKQPQFDVKRRWKSSSEDNAVHTSTKLAEKRQSNSLLQNLIKEPDFICWMKSVLALYKLKEALTIITQDRFISFIDEFNQEELRIFLQCLSDQNVKHVKLNPKLKQSCKWKCMHHSCKTIFSKLLEKHTSNQSKKWTFEIIAGQFTSPDVGQQLSVAKSNVLPIESAKGIPAKGLSDRFWEIGRLYTYIDSIEQESKCDSLEGLDISQIIKLMRSCDLFEFNGSAEVYDNIIKIRNSLMHSEDNKTDKDEMTKTFRVIYELLKQFQEFSDCQHITEELKQFESSDLVVQTGSLDFKCQDLEYCRVEVLKAMHLKQLSLEEDILLNPREETQKLQVILERTSDTLKLIEENHSDNGLGSLDLADLQQSAEDPFIEDDQLQEKENHSDNGLGSLDLADLQQSADDPFIEDDQLQEKENLQQSVDDPFIEDGQLQEKLNAFGFTESNDDLSTTRSIYCQECQRELNEENIVDFCEDCVIYLCNPCAKHHRTGEDHILMKEMNNSNYPPNKPLEYTNIEADRTMEINRTDKNKTPLCLQNIAIFDTDHILLTDRNENLVLIFNIREEQTVFVFPCKETPRDLTTVVAGRALAVTFSKSNSILILYVTENMRSVKHARYLNVTGECNLIRYSLGRLFVSFGQRKIQVLSLKNELLHTIKITKTRIDYFCVHNTSVYLVDRRSNCVKQYRLNGNPINEYKDKMLKCPECMFVTENRYLLVCDFHIKKFHLITADCKQTDVLPMPDVWPDSHVYMAFCPVRNIAYWLLRDSNSVYKFKIRI